MSSSLSRRDATPHAVSAQARFPNTDRLTEWLCRMSAGDPEAAQHAMPEVYDDLHRIARSCARDEPPDATLQPTALVHELFLRLTAGLLGRGSTSAPASVSAAQPERRWASRSHFLSTAARAMRRLLIDRGRRRDAKKRGGDDVRVPLEVAQAQPLAVQEAQLDALEDALRELARVAPDDARLVELRFISGLPLDRAADVLGISRRTASRRWRRIRAWLYSELSDCFTKVPEGRALGSGGVL